MIEIKCPFSCKDRSFLEAIGDKNFCLESSEDGNYTLKRQHAYFYQVQLQMKLCDVEFCDFVIWRSDELVVNRIERDDTFLLEAIDKATNFYKYGILPELVGKWYTAVSSGLSGQALSHGSALLPSPQASTSGSSSQGGTSQETWCYCNTEESGTMILGVNEQCPIKWFHVECVRITTILKNMLFFQNAGKKRNQNIKKEQVTLVV